MHPMTQMSSAILALQTESVFAAEYAKGTHKAKYWEHTYEDMMNLIARLPEVCAIIYRCTYFDGKVAPYDSSLDYSGNFCKMLGLDDEGFMELMRLYIVIHSDHEGGNASAHTCHLVGSTLSDPYARPGDPPTPCHPPRATHPVPHSPCHTARATQPVPHSPCRTARAAQPVPHSPCRTARAAQPVPHSPCRTARATGQEELICHPQPSPLY